MNIGQNFSPTNNDPNAQPQQGAGGQPIQQAIQILKLRFPHFFGGNSPSPLAGAGAAMMPPGASPMPLPLPGGGMPPMGGQGAQPLPMPMMPMPQMGGGPQSPMGGQPVIHYQPPPPMPGGTAGPNPPGVFPPQQQRPQMPSAGLRSRIPTA